MRKQRFSGRTGWERGGDEFAAAVTRARENGRELIDLTVSNPTVCGFDYGAEVLEALRTDGNPTEVMIYDPDPKGIRSAREAVAQYYRDHGATLGVDAMVLTTSTSEAYSFLFRLLCDAGDEVLVARPSYPLFDVLADLDDVRLRPYPLFYDFGWWIDFAELERAIGPRTRAVMVVHPNNPTGHWTEKAERRRLEALCSAHGLALIVDEVFLDYGIEKAQAAQSFALGPHPALTFVLSGISKICALPQMKVAWLTTFGPADAVAEAMARLEIVADTFLSVSAPTQMALPGWLVGRGAIQGQIRRRVATNLQRLREGGIEVLELGAGWAAVVRLRQTAADLVERSGVAVHPGEFYGLDRQMGVVSLITPETMVQEGAGRMARHAAV